MVFFSLFNLFIKTLIFSLTTGELNQIQLGDEITLKIKPEFGKFDKTRFDEVIALHYERKNQVWYFIPYKNEDFFHTIWINDYVNKAWFKRVIPQNAVTACVFNDDILISDENGKVYKEDFGSTFTGEPIDFMWKSPFLAIGDSNVRKTIDEFYFILDESYDNNFHFSVYKDYDSEYKDDLDAVSSSNRENLVWFEGNSSQSRNFVWNDNSEESLWAIGADAFYKAEISESNYAIQLCVEGKSSAHSAAIVGLEFKDIYEDE